VGVDCFSKMRFYGIILFEKTPLQEEHSMSAQSIFLGFLLSAEAFLFWFFRGNLWVARGVGWRMMMFVVVVANGTAAMATFAKPWFGFDYPLWATLPMTIAPTVLLASSWPRLRVALLVGRSSARQWSMADNIRLCKFVQNRPKVWQLKLSPHTNGQRMSYDLRYRHDANNNCFSQLLPEGTRLYEVQVAVLDALGLPRQRSQGGCLTLPYVPSEGK
jgi:hypothetical protein